MNAGRRAHVALQHGGGLASPNPHRSAQESAMFDQINAQFSQYTKQLTECTSKPWPPSR